MATSIYNIQEILETGYKIENQELVGQFLNENPFLIPLLKLISSQVKIYFPESSLLLEDIIDPEIPNYERIFIGITSDYELLDVMERLQKFDEGWWLDNSPLAQDKIIIDIR